MTTTLPTTLEDAIALIQRLDRELIALKTQLNSRGAGADLLRQPENFQRIDDILRNFSRSTPFKMSELFTQWTKATGLADETQYVKSALQKHFHALLTLNGYVIKVGGNRRSALYRVNSLYNYVLSRTKELTWRKVGQVEGTYLVPVE